MTLPPPGFVVEQPPAFFKDSWRKRGYYTADQMRAYRLEGVLEEREACAKLCEENAYEVGAALAAAIRARTTPGAAGEHRL